MIVGIAVAAFAQAGSGQPSAIEIVAEPAEATTTTTILESQGLIDPDRSPSGYRQFDSQDVARLSFILQQQRDHFLPLKVIKSKLTLWERGEDLDSRVAGSESNASSGEPLSRDEVLKRSGLTDQQLQDLLDAGVIRHIPNSTVFQSEIGVAALEAKRLMDLGLEARHLRAIRLSVDREVDLLRQLTAPLMRARNAESQARARDLLESSTGSVQALHRALLAGELKQPPVQ